MDVVGTGAEGLSTALLFISLTAHCARGTARARRFFVLPTQFRSTSKGKPGLTSNTLYSGGKLNSLVCTVCKQNQHGPMEVYPALDTEVLNAITQNTMLTV